MPEHLPQAHNPLVLLGRAATVAVEEYGYWLALVGKRAFKIADRITILDHGRILLQGDAKSVRNSTRGDGQDDAF